MYTNVFVFIVCRANAQLENDVIKISIDWSNLIVQINPIELID